MSELRRFGFRSFRVASCRFLEVRFQEQEDPDPCFRQCCGDRSRKPLVMSSRLLSSGASSRRKIHPHSTPGRVQAIRRRFAIRRHQPCLRPGAPASIKISAGKPGYCRQDNPTSDGGMLARCLDYPMIMRDAIGLSPCNDWPRGSGISMPHGAGRVNAGSSGIRPRRSVMSPGATRVAVHAARCRSSSCRRGARQDRRRPMSRVDRVKRRYWPRRMILGIRRSPTRQRIAKRGESGADETTSGRSFIGPCAALSSFAAISDTEMAECAFVARMQSNRAARYLRVIGHSLPGLRS